MTIPKSINYDCFRFEITHRDPHTRARLGRLETPHGSVETPNFIFCATKGTVKATPGHRLKDLNTQIILSNTYHLMLQPGSTLIKKAGGLHQFMGWSGPLLTDSGGYQIFAMGHGSVSEEIKRISKFKQRSLVKMTEEGCWFQSYLDGKKIFLTPEKSIEVQIDLGADLIVQLDECTPYHISYKATRASMERSMRWGDRSLTYFIQNSVQKQAIYGVIQGGVHLDLREESVHYVTQRPFFGIAVGGSLGKSKVEMYRVISSTLPKIERHLKEKVRPIHLLGVGEIKDVFFGIRQGIDTFDCVVPTRLARHGSAIVASAHHPERNQTRINLKNKKYREDHTPLAQCPPELKIYTKSYLHHLIKAKEILALQILTEHNIYQMNLLMKDIRKAIQENQLDRTEKFWCGEKAEDDNIKRIKQ